MFRLFHKKILRLNSCLVIQYVKQSKLAQDLCYKNRGSFNTVDESHLSFFKHLLGESRVLTKPEDLMGYNVQWLKLFQGSSKVVLRPKTSDEISKILSFCNQNRLAVCPQGGNTSMSGGSTAVFDEIILSLSLMNRIITFDEASDVLECEAGCTLESLDNYLADNNLMMPIDLGSKGSCQIGGNVATNAGGIRLFRYGNLHGSVLGLEVVKANGAILNCLSSLKKDNTGYHLNHLFIGSEGTLGIITKVAIKCVPLPKYNNVAFFGLQSFDKVLETFQSAKNNLNEILSSCEMMDFQTMNMVESNLHLKNAIGNYPFYMLLETAGCDGIHNEEKLTRFLNSCLNQELIVDGTVAADSKRCKALWEVRERAAEAMRYDGFVLMYDLSFSLKHFYILVPELTNILGTKCHRVFGFGHLGDGNLHLQVSLRGYDEDMKSYIDEIVYQKVAELKGSVSAEHGIGFLKTNILHHSKSKSSINLMYDIKKMMDPNGILNPYKVLKMTV